ncbi:MAG TPA: type I methionyl aminopeptidase [Candidatus Polarisedimenticolaceae bacterium]|nr:type I methionyl aminopeptidase [Candidatus Polarisedimenticolaceae bacterium]
MSVETREELLALKEAGRIVRAALDAMSEAVAPGVMTASLDGIAEGVLRAEGARSAPRLVYGFPAATCISINDEVVHGIPSERRLAEGDLVTLDVTVEKEGFMADAAVTVPVGRTDSAAKALLAAAQRALSRALAAARAGARLNEIGRAVSYSARRDGFNVVRELSGHGIGRTIHEPPAVPNVYERTARQRLNRGLVLAIEPMLTSGSGHVVEDADGWTVRTADGALAAHAEHTIVVTEGAPLVLTAA